MEVTLIHISACIIAKNEENKIGSCLKHLKNYVDEIIVVDTGSIDKTKQIAYEYTDDVYDFSWLDDFSEARNYSIAKASNEYILIIDCDERIESFDRYKLEELIKGNPDKVGRILRRNKYHRGEQSYTYVERVNRFFPKSSYHYEGSIHEQIVSIRNDAIKTYDIPIEADHDGYEGALEQRREKTQRNIHLLLKELGKSPRDTYLLYQLGKSYYMEEDFLSAYQYFDKALQEELNIHLEYVQDMMESYGYTLLNLEEYDTALQLLNIYDEFSNSADFIFLIGLIFMNNGMFIEAINEFLKATKYSIVKMEGVNTYLSYYNIGVIYECLGDKDRARYYYVGCGNYDKARDRLEQL